MENWEFLLQRKGDKSWLPLESPTVEILEGQYRLAARTDQSNMPVGIAITYRPLADVRYEPLQQKIAKRVSHDGLLIVMPYTSFTPGLWEIACLLGKDASITNPVTKAISFDVVPISFESGLDWQYPQADDLTDADDADSSDNLSANLATNRSNNLLGISQTDPTAIATGTAPISPILEIAEQRSTELVQSMFEEFTLFAEAENEDNLDLLALEEDDMDANLSAPMSPQTTSHHKASDDLAHLANMLPSQPRSLLRLQQLQYLIDEQNQFVLEGEAYATGEIEVILKDPQTLDIVTREIFNLADISPDAKGAISFKHQVIVPEPDQLPVLIGEVQIHPQQDLQQYHDLLIMQQAITVSYPASRVLAAILKAAKESSQQTDQQEPRPPESLSPIANHPAPTPDIPPTKPPLTLPPLPTNRKPISQEPEIIRAKGNISLPPLPLPAPADLLTTDSTLQEIETEFAQINLMESAPLTADSEVLSSSEESPSAEPELVYMFEEELPTASASIPLAQQPPKLELPPQTVPQGRDERPNRFLNKLQTLSAEAIAAQKASQRTEELLLDTFPPSDSLLYNDTLAEAPPAHPNSDAYTALSVEHDDPHLSIRTIEEANTLAELDLELDAEFDRLLIPESDRILNEYVWEDPVDPNLFPIADVLSPSQEPPSPSAMPEQEPIPVPEILIPAGEIISGTPMQVLLRLPAIAGKFFVKFWIKDLQTRAVIDGPRWLLDFQLVPNSDTMETRTNISIPLSSVDVAFEAITMESQTQRESHKARLVRAVTPPNFANEFDGEV
jgi:hypothetical protein